MGSVDLIADAGSLGAQLADLTPRSRVGDEPPSNGEDEGLPAIAERLKHATGMDFAGYKSSTLQRQVRRRMAIRKSPDVDAYLALLADDEDEAAILASNILVTVTSFFRDPEAFEALRGHLTTYLRDFDSDSVLRVWVPGCATGEEVYSIAMLVSEVLERPSELHRRLKIFGTDLDESSLAVARRAVYSPQAMSNLPDDLRDLYTIETDAGFQVAEIIRECTVFARHDVGEDPPFPRIDLVSFRNTLIYFKEALQARVIGMLEFALRGGGLLFLGSAENLDSKARGFRAIDVDHRLFARTGEAAPKSTRTMTPPSEAPDRKGSGSGVARRSARAQKSELMQQVMLLEAVLRQSGRAFLVLDDDHRLVEVVGDVGEYCRVAEGRMTGEIMSFLREELQAEARAVLLLSRAESMPITGHSVRLHDHDVHLVATRVPVGDATFTTLMFERESISRGTGSHAPWLWPRRSIGFVSTR
jgi:two-component system, chemotaxis family, CheB/CheR fusion protein